jgi:hypothetical protein
VRITLLTRRVAALARPLLALAMLPRSAVLRARS